MHDATNPKPVTISREELYKRVWATPMSRLALEFGISGNGLAKICDRLNIPYPPRGYWARKEAGQKVVTFRLPARAESTPNEVAITPTPPPRQLSPDQQASVTAARAATDGIEVVAELKRPHPVISGWLQDHKDQRRRQKLERNPYRAALAEWTECDLRQHRILDAIFRAVEKYGVAVKSDARSGFWFEYTSEKISCRLREKNKQVRRQKTADELRWSISGDKDWAQALEPTGNLVFTIEDYFGSEYGIRREWLETPTKRLENMVPDIVAMLLLAGSALIKIRQDREEQKRRYEEAERQRQLDAAKRKLERNQWRALTEKAEHHETARKVSQLLDELEQKDFDPAELIGDRPISEWLVWARRRVEALDPVHRGIAAVFDDLSKVTDWSYRD